MAHRKMAPTRIVNKIFLFFQLRPFEFDELIRADHGVFRLLGMHETIEHDGKADDGDDGNDGDFILFQLFGYHRYAPPVSAAVL